MYGLVVVVVVADLVLPPHATEIPNLTEPFMSDIVYMYFSLSIFVHGWFER
jgi:hypothetical protein